MTDAPVTDLAPEHVLPTSAAEREVADLLPIGADPGEARRVRDAVPLWFHTFALAPGLYTPGIARDHRYRIPALGRERFAGRRVLDVGSFDGFYAFLAEALGAERVLAIDNEQYVSWVKGRFGIDLTAAAGFDAIHGLLDSHVSYTRLDVFNVGTLGERFDLALCFGMLHRVTDPVGVLAALAATLDQGGEILVETYGSSSAEPVLELHAAGHVYPGDNHVHWGFPAEGLRRLGEMVGLDEIEVVDEVVIDGHPRIIATLREAGSRA